MQKWQEYFLSNKKYIDAIIRNIHRDLMYMDLDDLKQWVMIFIWWKYDTLKDMELKYIGREIRRFVKKQYDTYEKKYRLTNCLMDFDEAYDMASNIPTPEKKMIDWERLKFIYNEYPIYADFIIKDMDIKDLAKKYNATKTYIITEINRTKKQLGV